LELPFKRKRNAEREEERNFKHERVGDEETSRRKIEQNGKSKQNEVDPRKAPKRVQNEGKKQRFRRDDQNKKKSDSSTQAIATKEFHHEFPGETFIPCCRGNIGKLFCYRIITTPNINLASTIPTKIWKEGKEYCFDSFVLVSHHPISVPPLVFVRSGIEYKGTLEELKLDFLLQQEELNWFHTYFFDCILKMKDWLPPTIDPENLQLGCRRFHLFPRFICKEELSAKAAMEKMLPLFDIIHWLASSPTTAADYFSHFDLNTVEGKTNARNLLVDFVAVSFDNSHDPYRIDDLDFTAETKDKMMQEIPSQHLLSMQYVCYFSWPILVHRPVLPFLRRQGTDRVEEQKKEILLNPYLVKITGLRTDICQMGILLPTICYHVRLFTSLSKLEDALGVQFNDKELLKKVMNSFFFSPK
jgi:hypothetical protein